MAEITSHKAEDILIEFITLWQEQTDTQQHDNMPEFYAHANGGICPVMNCIYVEFVSSHVTNNI